MRAALIIEHGGSENVVVGEIDKPTPGPDEVIIKVEAVALNYLDIFVRRGIPGRNLPLPHISGGDVAGIIDEVGENVTNVKIGDRVVIDPIIPGHGALGEDLTGGLAEYAKVPAENCIHLPEEISFEEAAALPIAYGTAQRMLFTRGNLKAGETIVVLGASGGVGNAAVLLAKNAGATVIAVAGSNEKLEKLKQLGADYVINYHETNFSNEVWRITGKKGADIIVDNSGKETWPHSIRTTRKGGRIVTCGATSGHDALSDLRYIFKREITILGSTGWRRSDLEYLLNLVKENKLRPVIHSVLPLDKIREAHDLMENRQIFGKIIIRPKK